jgi:serine/threonine protein kinase
MKAGDVVREWTLVQEIGRGGAGVVFRARHRFLGGEFAIKLLHSGVASHNEAQERLLQEASTLAMLRHPHIVESLPPFEDNGILFVPMELLPGTSMFELLRHRKIAWPEGISVELLRQAADGVGFAHSKGVLHRDLKPGNIFVAVGPAGLSAKVLDFGLAKVLGEQSLTTSGAFVGTPAYTAPEIIKGSRASPQSDVYGLGLVLYRCLAARMPFVLPDEDRSPWNVISAVMRAHEAGLPPVTDFASVSSAVRQLIERCLDPDPTGRPEDAAQLARALEQANQDSGAFQKPEARQWLEQAANFFASARRAPSSSWIGPEMGSASVSGRERSTPVLEPLELSSKRPAKTAWILCPHCSLRHSPRADGTCPRCNEFVHSAPDDPVIAGLNPPISDAPPRFRTLLVSSFVGVLMALLLAGFIVFRDRLDTRFQAQKSTTSTTAHAESLVAAGPTEPAIQTKVTPSGTSTGTVVVDARDPGEPVNTGLRPGSFDAIDAAMEPYRVLKGLYAAQQQFRSSNDCYVTAGPEGPGSRERGYWDETPCRPDCNRLNPYACQNFRCLGFHPEGRTFYRYACTAVAPARGIAPNFTCAAIVDLDSNGRTKMYLIGSANGPQNHRIQAPIPLLGDTGDCQVGATPAGEVFDCNPGEI